MRNIALVLTLPAAMALLAESSSYRITQTYNMAAGITSCPIPQITVCLSPGRIA
jgi:hypothetical protein